METMPTPIFSASMNSLAILESTPATAGVTAAFEASVTQLSGAIPSLVGLHLDSARTDEPEETRLAPLRTLEAIARLTASNRSVAEAMAGRFKDRRAKVCLPNFGIEYITGNPPVSDEITIHVAGAMLVAGTQLLDLMHRFDFGFWCNPSSVSHLFGRCGSLRIKVEGTLGRREVLPLTPEEIAYFGLGGIDLEDLEQDLYPGRASGSGFLFPREKLAGVLRRDRKTLEDSDLTKEHFAAFLLKIVSSCRTSDFAASNPGSDMCFDRTLLKIGSEYFWCHVERYLGWQTSPFNPQYYKGGDLDFVLVSLRDYEIFSFCGIQIELVSKHGFFEGSVRHRIDPSRWIMRFGRDTIVDPAIERVSYEQALTDMLHVETLTAAAYKVFMRGRVPEQQVDEALEFMRDRGTLEEFAARVYSSIGLYSYPPVIGGTPIGWVRR